MPMLFTSKNIEFITKQGDTCQSTYQKFDESRIFEPIAVKDITAQTAAFTARVIDNIHDTKVGQYCTLRTSELEALLTMADKTGYVEIHNAVDADGYAIMIVAPIDKDYKLQDTPTTIYIAAFPCPPHPACMGKPLQGNVPNGNLFQAFK